jgi:hypothetical protein
MNRVRKLRRYRFALGLTVLALFIGMTGCAGPSALLLPVTGAPGQMQVQEYALVEESVDSPTHVTFQQRVPAAVAARRAGWHFPGLEDAVQGQNKLLAPFGYHLEANPTPPFSGFALYYNNGLLYRDIRQFWPVSLKDNGDDFLLPFQTMNGDKLVASSAGVKPWPGEGGKTVASAAPVYYGDQVAYAEISGSEINVYAGPSKLYSAPTTSASAPASGSLQSWGKNHWGLEVDGHLIVDGVDLNQADGYSEVLFFQVLNGQPLYFYTRGDQTFLNYAGHNLAYSYDKVIHNDQGSLSIFNPGSDGRVAWFYALRDGLWYYVEVGFFD